MTRRARVTALHGDAHMLTRDDDRADLYQRFSKHVVTAANVNKP